MPTMSSSFFQPTVTPCTALKTNARVSPCTAAYWSPARLTCSAPSLVSREMPSATSADTLPFGPSTRTVLPSTLYFTPEGSGITFFPIRDIECIPYWLASPEKQLSVISDQMQRTLVPLQPENSDQVSVISVLQSFFEVASVVRF